MKEKILNYLEKNPMSRQRNIASGIGVWFLDKEFLDALFSLREENKIEPILHNDMANMEHYNLWRLR